VNRWIPSLFLLCQITSVHCSKQYALSFNEVKAQYVVFYTHVLASF